MRALTLVFALALLVPSAAWAAQDPPEHWEPDIRAFEQKDRESPPAPGAVLFVGSSSIQKWSTLAADFPKARVLNRGFGGSVIADSTFFAGRIVTPYKPRLIVFYAGDNDLAAGHTPDQVLADYEAFVARVRKDLPDVKIAFIAIKPSPSRVALLEKAREANGKIKAYASSHPNLTYVDVFTPMLTKDGAPRAELFGDDMLHMNRAGYELWISILGPIVSP